MDTKITQNTTHDLWVEARQFSLTATRVDATSMQLTVQYPSTLSIVDGFIILVSPVPFTVDDQPVDGTVYDASTILGDSAASMIDGSQVVAFYSKTKLNPAPVTKVNDHFVGTLTITNLDPSTVYYCSVHGLSNVLQYYPFGIQSYPLDASRIETAKGVFTGSLLTLPYAPTTPTPGFVYYDKSLDLVQYYDGTNGIWLSTRMDTILSGPSNPGVLGQTYLINGTELKGFDGTKFIPLTAENTVVKDSTNSFVPMGQVYSSMTAPESPVVGDFYYSYTTERIQYFDGATWQYVKLGTVLLVKTGSMVPMFTTKFTVEYDDLVEPYVGLLFYNTEQKQLNVWNGTKWTKCNTSQDGTPTTDKVGIGTDGTYDDRQRLIKVLKLQLGWPTQCVELTEEHFNIGIDNALDTYRQLCSHAYERRFMMYTLFANQSVYFLNSPVDQTDKVVNVSRIFRLNTFGLTTGATWDTNVFIQNFASFYYSTAYVDLLSIHLMANLQEEMSRIFAGEYMFTWSEARREMMLTRRVPQNEKVVLEVFMEKTEQEIILDRFAKQFIQGWALAECKEMLGMIRSKYTSGTPGASGNITLNGDTLLTEARTDFTEWKQALIDWEHASGEAGNISFLMG